MHACGEPVTVWRWVVGQFESIEKRSDAFVRPHAVSDLEVSSLLTLRISPIAA
jgi:hypothetical protein